MLTSDQLLYLSTAISRALIMFYPLAESVPYHLPQHQLSEGPLLETSGAVPPREESEP